MESNFFLASLSCLAVASCCVATPTANVTYFVSSSNANASDGNDGTAPERPWRTLGRAAATALPPTAHASILLRGGDTWPLPDTLEFSSFGAQTLLSAYFDEGSTAQRPVLARVGPLGGPLVRLLNGSRVRVEGLEFRGGEFGVLFAFRTPLSAWNLSSTVSDCVFRGVRALSFNATGGMWWGAAIAAAASHADFNASGLVIANNAAHSCDTFYHSSVALVDPLPWTIVHTSALLIAGNFITNTTYNSVALMWTDRTTLASNVFLRNGPPLDTPFRQGLTDVILGALDSSVRIDDNEVGWRVEGATLPDGCALDFEVASRNVTLSRNYFHHCWGAGVLVFGHGTTSTGLLFVNNTFLWNGCGQTSADRGDVALVLPNSTGSIRGSRATMCAGVPFVAPRWPQSADGWTIEGNALDGQNASLAVLGAPIVNASLTTDGAGGGEVLLLNAACPQNSCPQGTVLRFTVDGSKPSATSPPLPGAGLLLPLRTVTFLVKAFPPDAAPQAAGGAAGDDDLDSADASLIYVESPAEGGIFDPADL